MSFQDFGRSPNSSGSSNRMTASGAGAARYQGGSKVPIPASARQSSSVAAAASSVNNSSSSSSPAAVLGQISEALNQYQRNVGILEKIVASLTANTAASRTNKSELQMQYKAQVDVVEQLSDKVLRLCREQSVHTNSASTSSSSTTKTALIKLQRDFERVQSRAMALQQKVTQTMAAAAAAQQQDAEALSSNNPNQAYEDYQRQVQMQLQQDRLDESIMREREEELRNINRGMHQVNEIYKDLAHIVGSQQEQVDAIETQMEDSRANAEAGLQQVEKANENFGATQCVIS